MVPPTFNSISNRLRVTFVSDGSVGAPGFSARYRAVAPSESEYTMWGGPKIPLGMGKGMGMGMDVGMGMVWVWVWTWVWEWTWVWVWELGLKEKSLRAREPSNNPSQS